MQHLKIDDQVIKQLQSLEDCQSSNLLSANQIYLSPERNLNNRLGDNNIYQEVEWEIQDDRANDIFTVL